LDKRIHRRNAARAAPRAACPYPRWSEQAGHPYPDSRWSVPRGRGGTGGPWRQWSGIFRWVRLRPRSDDGRHGLRQSVPAVLRYIASTQSTMA